MAQKELLLLGDPRLREKALPVEKWSGDLEKVIEDLKDTLFALQKEYGTGRALAAPQIGYPVRVIYYHEKGKELIMVNPEIVEDSLDKFQVWDSCFSFKMAFYVRVLRHRKIKVRFYDEIGEEQVLIFKDDLAELFQHEFDHLEGILATDHLEDNKEIIMAEERDKV